MDYNNDLNIATIGIGKTTILNTEGVTDLVLLVVEHTNPATQPTTLIMPTIVARWLASALLELSAEIDGTDAN